MGKNLFIKNEIAHKRVPTLFLSKEGPGKGEQFTCSGPVPIRIKESIPRLNVSTPEIGNSVPFGLRAANSPLGGRRNRYNDILETVPLSFTQLEEGKNKENVQTLLIESILIDSYAKLKLHDQDDEESKRFKKSIIPTCQGIQLKKRLTFLYAVKTNIGWPVSLPKEFSATFNFPVVNIAKAYDLTPETNVNDMIKKILSSSHVSSLKTKPPDSVILKFCDYDEYLHHEMNFGALIRIRDDLARNKPIRFTVVDKKTLQESYDQAEYFETMYNPRSTTDLFSLTAPPVPAKNSLSVHDIDYNFRVRILAIDNFAENFPSYAKEMEDDADAINSYQISVELYHGPEHITPPLWSESLKTVNFDEWIGVNSLKVCQVSFLILFIL